ncbi:S-formylglutathione hydrolase [Thecamonas trahens ATCC 50062]|uniref:S-formylglutathione hydrolase n=1 Tax=Thecamonas trahens ATCC 50062 TaxID=461836 RepID=A0A0L0DGW3_THETB|nr:S-formylglutathione hydrolase [Thecamonas trahens ATCC 50062]KNC51569.1 S-formylglutathione hydrolase [Thecamonas trahens ATCC 50062]|eukprot:XP_013755971.1 S-formylglutathione hydrolase [Thecamonas trahens ATCC 50062]
MADSAFKLVSSNRMFGGLMALYSHYSSVLKCTMEFRVFHPPTSTESPAPASTPVLYYLSGLTCTSENFATKGYAQAAAAKAGLALICPDTSPRGVDLPGEDESYDFGSGAGFYLNATRDPWSQHYRMYDYVVDELPGVLKANFPELAVGSKEAIFGHSMGGHGALVLALSNPGRYASASAFAPICNPINCPWGVKAFTGYLGDDDKTAWEAYDASVLARSYAGPKIDVLVDQGTDDQFLKEHQLLPETLAAAAAANDQLDVELRMQDGYDHSYYFIATFVEDHIAFHAKYLL